MSSFVQAAWWPESCLHQHPVTQVYVCGRQTRPPLASQVVSLPRLEIPLEGCYENQIELNQRPATVALKPGSALLVPPNGWNLPTWREPVRFVSILFGKKQLGLSLVASQSPAQPGETLQKCFCPSPVTGPLPKVLETLREVHAAGGPKAALPDLVRALLCCVEYLVIRPVAQEPPLGRTLLQEVCGYLQDNFAQGLSRESVAQHFGISPSYLSRVFHVQGRMTFSHYLTQVRTDRAKYLLRDCRLKLDEVAARCGYRDTAYFCRVFKRLTRLTPAEYRAQYKAGALSKEMVFSQ